MDLHHETITFDRTFPVPPARLFRALTDPREREAWSAPSADIEVRIDECDVRSGGRETGRCGPKGDLRWTMEVAWHVVEPDRLVVFTEVLSEAARLLTVALITYAVAEHEGGARLLLTDQVTSLLGADGASGHRSGYTRALDNLARHVLDA